MGKLTISMAIFNSYVPEGSLPEGNDFTDDLTVDILMMISWWLLG